MRPKSYRTHVELFVAVTRAVRDADVAEGTRRQAFAAVEGMAGAIGQSRFEIEFEALCATARRDRGLAAALQPFWPELGVLSGSPSERRAGASTA